jgi:hypothetical protein
LGRPLAFLLQALVLWLAVQRTNGRISAPSPVVTEKHAGDDAATKFSSLLEIRDRFPA